MTRPVGLVVSVQIDRLGLWPRLNQSVPSYLELFTGETVWSRLVQTGPDWARRDQAGPGWARLDLASVIPRLAPDSYRLDSSNRLVSS